jgi:hypothetical protein
MAFMSSNPENRAYPGSMSALACCHQLRAPGHIASEKPTLRDLSAIPLGGHYPGDTIPCHDLFALQILDKFTGRTVLPR